MSSEDSESSSSRVSSRRELFDVDNESSSSLVPSSDESIDVDKDLYCLERPLWPNDNVYIPREKINWNVATHHLRKAIGFQCPREILWIKTLVAFNYRAQFYGVSVDKWARKMNNNGKCNIVREVFDKIQIEVPRDRRGKWLFMHVPQGEKKNHFKNGGSVVLHDEHRYAGGVSSMGDKMC
ncbi:hypothetical protein ALC62_00801 [Cyphomyrmex costatus]|uniref:Uncharacterized protein n=1 Tax=Cyphomyrmex costatus TaxID=456900 RepID=A0A151IPX4_9HYME|nr:hypothetical protein ALC62_00801 [Cyphomyrmex costatus]